MGWVLVGGIKKLTQLLQWGGGVVALAEEQNSNSHSVMGGVVLWRGRIKTCRQ